MTESATDLSRYTAATAFAEAGWEPLQRRLVSGFCHDINGRLAAFYGLLYAVEAGDPVPPGYDGEIQRLEDMSERLAKLAGDLEADALPMAMSELLEGALRLFSGLKDLDGRSIEADVPGDLPALLVNEARCLRLLLLFADTAVRCETSETGTLEASGDREGVRIGFDVHQDRLEAGTIVALDRAAGLDGGSVRLEEGRCVLELPSLSRARAQGR